MAARDYCEHRRTRESSEPRRAPESSSKDPGSNLTGTRHDATHLRTKISFYEKSRSENAQNEIDLTRHDESRKLRAPTKYVRLRTDREQRHSKQK